jgi:hypothetical protein
MEQRPARAYPTSGADPPSVVSVTVIGDGRPSPLRTGGLALLAVIAAVAVVVAIASRAHPPAGHVRSQHTARPAAPAGAQSPAGMDAIQTVFRNSLQCMTLAFAPSQPAYFRAIPLPGCSHPGSHHVEVFHQVGGQLRLVLDGGGQACVGAPIPALVQVELGVCRGSPASLYQARPALTGRVDRNPQGGPFQPNEA